MIEFQFHLMNQYMNTPILDKINHCNELPQDFGQWIMFDCELNMKYAEKLFIHLHNFKHLTT